MATPSTSNAEESTKKDEGTYECHICFEQATDAVISMCGHLFCWPCIHRWMESRPTSPTCPVCKSAIETQKLIPLYGRGSTDQKDPREKIPPRPQGHREEPQATNHGTGVEGINISFGIGALPFTMLGGPMIQGFMNNQQQPIRPREEQRLAKVFIFIGVVILLMIIFS